MKKLVTIAAVLATGVALAEVSWKKTPTGLEVKADGVTRALSFYGGTALRVKSDLGAGREDRRFDRLSRQVREDAPARSAEGGRHQEDHGRRRAHV